jgi:hypothetical protein
MQQIPNKHRCINWEEAAGRNNRTVESGVFCAVLAEVL